LFHRKALKNESEVANLFPIPEPTVSEELKSEEAADVLHLTEHVMIYK
jgi:hypothetical protein